MPNGGMINCFECDYANRANKRCSIFGTPVHVDLLCRMFKMGNESARWKILRRLEPGKIYQIDNAHHGDGPNPRVAYETRAVTRLASSEESPLLLLSCLDSSEMAASCRRDLEISRGAAAGLGRSAVDAARIGHYTNRAGDKVDWSREVAEAIARKLSIPPGAPLAPPTPSRKHRTQVQVTNETTLAASRRLVDDSRRPLALNFANGRRPGGGFLNGALAQEEVLCRSSALFVTLADDPMYEHHGSRPKPDSSDWVILSPDVPVFRLDNGQELDRPWLLSFLTCAAPYAPSIGQPEAGDLLKKRIHRALEVAWAFGYETLVLGAWGCGAFANDPYRTAQDFRDALETEFQGQFADVVFAIADWSAERRFIGPFAEVFRRSSASTPGA